MDTLRRAVLLLVTLALALAGGLAAAPAASAASLSPPGANDFSCRPSASHPRPVVLVPGTFETMVKNWSVLSPRLKAAGYCVYALDDGTTNGVPATGPIEDSAKQLAAFVAVVLRSTGARQVDLVGHSQGGMMPRYYLRFLGGTRSTHALIGLSPSNHGTQGLLVASPQGGEALAPLGTGPDPACTACAQQRAGSAFLTRLNAGGDLAGSVVYTVISTTHDEVVTPYTSQALAGPAARVTNAVVQDSCPLDPVDHDQTPNDPVVAQLVLAALAGTGPLARSFRPACA